MVFRKAKMLERLEREGRTDNIDEHSKVIMDMLDGKEAEKNHFKALVEGIEVYYVTADNGINYPVNKLDCE